MYVSCPQCEANYQVSDDNEGKTMKCAGCGTAFRARISRAAIKIENTPPAPSGNWPSKLPTLSPTKVKASNPNSLYVGLGIAGSLILVALIACLIYVYRINSPDNIYLDRDFNQSATSTNVD